MFQGPVFVRHIFRLAGVAFLVAGGALLAEELPYLFSDPLRYVDWPLHPEFVDGGAWDPSGGLLDVAAQTMGTVTSCIEFGGKPFWQMQLGISSWIDAVYSAPYYEEDRRVPWCSETIAYWHLRAQTPHNSGYQCDWNPGTWQLKSTRALREWYQTAERHGPVVGKGRWIDGEELDVTNFIPGVNGPCPGAYQQLEGYSDGEWEGSGEAHSQIVDRITTWEDERGRIYRIDVEVIEGGGARVRDDRGYEDIRELTVLGDGAIGEDWKIRGWGVDLDASGAPLYDASRIRRVRTGGVVGDLPGTPRRKRNEVDLQVERLFQYGKLVMNRPITASSASESVRGLGEGLPGRLTGKTWVVDGAGPGEPVEIEIDLIGSYPRPLRGAVLTFGAGALPRSIEVKAVTRKGQTVSLGEREIGSIQDAAFDANVQIPVLSEQGGVADVRFLVIALTPRPNSPNLEIREVRLETNHGPEDAGLLETQK